LSWFLNLEVLFERAIRQRLGAITASTVSVNKGSPSTTPVFDQTSSLIANPDLILTSPDAVIVGDVKYKNWTGTAAPSDIYQLLVHAAAFDAGTAFLIYPSDHFEAKNLTLAATGSTVWLFAMDVRKTDASLSTVCEQLDIPVQADDAV
jgi:5-methylcytosine-specific restriction endonuclease McrBC regulatory subunit McrC